MKLAFFMGLMGPFLCLALGAATEIDIEESTPEMVELQEKLAALEVQQEEAKLLSSRLVVEYENASRGGLDALYFWQNAQDRELKRENKKSKLRILITAHQRELESLKQNKERIQAQLSLAKLQASLKDKQHKQIGRIGKTLFPLANLSNVFLERGFGKVEDPSTGISWQHPGWLLALGSSQPVRSMHPGTVVYKGGISGKGQVLIIEEAKNRLSVYAHLDQIHPKLRVGAKIARGQKIGLSSEKLYLEIKKGERNLNPIGRFAKEFKSINL